MLHTTPDWVSLCHLPRVWNRECARLLPDKIVGPWYCLERSTGELLWKRRLFRADKIIGIARGIIVATEKCHQCPPRPQTLGCYGISQADGHLVWTAHANGVFGRILRLLDYLGGLNRRRDSPIHVRGGEVYCRSGRILDIHTGRYLRRQTPDAIPLFEPTRKDFQLWFDDDDFKELKFRFGREPWNDHEGLGTDCRARCFKIVAENEHGPVWTESVRLLNELINDRYFSCRFAPPYLYLLLSGPREPIRKRDRGHAHERYPTDWSLVTIKLETGRMLQSFPLAGQKLHRCEIHDMDVTGLLVGNSEWGSATPLELQYFSRRPVQPTCSFAE